MLASALHLPLGSQSHEKVQRIIIRVERNLVAVVEVEDITRLGVDCLGAVTDPHAAFDTDLHLVVVVLVLERLTLQLPEEAGRQLLIGGASELSRSPRYELLPAIRGSWDVEVCSCWACLM